MVMISKGIWQDGRRVFSQPVILLPEGLQFYEHPKVATDSNGTWVLGWIQTNFIESVKKLYFTISRDDGETWSPPEALYKTSAGFELIWDAWRSAFVIVFSASISDGDNDIYVTSYANGNWTPPLPVNHDHQEDSSHDRTPKIAAHRGTWVVTWAGSDPTDHRDIGHFIHIFHQQYRWRADMVRN